LKQRKLTVCFTSGTELAMLQKSRWRWLILAVVVVAAIVAGVIGSLRPNPGITLTNLNNVEELRARFNQDKGTPRLLLLLSPT
jgi:hypothetical protein